MYPNASYTRARRMVRKRKPNARMCGRDCEPAWCHLRMARIPFATNQNLSVFCANTKRTECAGCPLLASGSPAHEWRGVLVYTRFKIFYGWIFYCVIFKIIIFQKLIKQICPFKQSSLQETLPLELKIFFSI